MPGNTESQEFPVPQGLDPRQALENMRGKKNLLREVARTFLDDAPGQMDKVRQGLESGDAHLAAKSAHSMKSSLELLAAGRAHDLALQTELAGKAGDLEQAKSRFAELSAEMDQVFRELASLMHAS